MDVNVGIERYHIRDLAPDISNIVVIAIIIGKREARTFSKDNVTKAVWNCTIRDSPYDYINLTYWGTEEIILPLYEKFQIGDIIEVLKPKVFLRKIQDVAEQYEPKVTSPFKLVLGEQSNIIRHETNAFDKLHALIHIPTKPLITFITLNDVQNYDSVKDDYLNLLVAIRTVCEIRYVTLRTGFQQQVRDVIVFDHTYPNFKISLWDRELISRASFWKSKTTILFVVDMKVMWNNYFKCTTGSITSKTIITEDPIGNEAEMLKKYALLAPLQASSILDKLTTTLPDPATIQNVMSIERIVSKINIIINATNFDAEEQKFTALVYAVVTDLDLDGLSRVTCNKCANCKKFLGNMLSCDDPMCPMGSGDERAEIETTFDIRITLSDHTGSLTRCRLAGTIAETVLRCKVAEFLTMSDERKYRLKWRYLLERCAIRLLVLCLQGRGPIISILSCEVASPLDANKIPLC